MTPTLARLQSKSAESLSLGVSAFETLPSARRDRPDLLSPALNDASLRQVSLQPPSDLDAVEFVRGFQAIERQLGGRRNIIVQIATPARGGCCTDTAYSLAWAGASYLGIRVLLIDSVMAEPPARSGSGAKASGQAAATERMRREIAKRRVMARWPVAAQVLGMKRLADVAGPGHVEEAILKAADCNLFIGRLGAEQGRAGGRLTAHDIRHVLDDLRPSFDVILVAAGDALNGPLATVLAGIVDGSVLVLPAGDTPASAVWQAIHALDSGGAPILGAIVTQHRHFLPGWLGWLRAH